MTGRGRGFAAANVVVPLAAALGLVVLSQFSFLWFHALAELFAIVIGVSLYLIASRSYVFNRNDYLLFLAQGFFWAAGVDMVHTLAYAGMGLIKNNDPNPATQLWLLARGIEACTLLLAPRFLTGRRPSWWSFGIFGTVAVGGIALAFAGHLPTAYIVGQGLTPFKIAAEYAIVAVLLAAGAHLYLRRQSLDTALFRVMLGVVAFTVISELAFTAYVGVYDLSNLVGHIFKFWAFWLLLLAITHWMLAQPFRLLSRQANSFDHIPMPVLMTDAKGIVQSGNTAARQAHPEGGIGRPLHTVWHPAALDSADCPVCLALAKGQDCSVELHDKATDRWSLTRLHPLRQESGARGFVYVHNDITEAHQAQERLVQAEKMEAIGQLTGGLAHDFNNLLGVVLGGLNLLSARIGDDPKSQKHLDLAQRAARRAADVTHSLLTVARKQTLEPRDIAIESAFAEILPLLEQSIGKTVSIETGVCEDCNAFQVRVDPTGLGNALLNLAINARDAMPDGGRLKIEARAQTIVPNQPGVSPELLPGRYIVIGVSDTGSGMPPEVAAHAFDPFFTTKEKGRGTGLGLPMVHGFARQSGGTATIYTEPGAGTTVRLYLPAVAAPLVAAKTLAPSPPPIPRGGTERILVVDDEEDILAVAGEWLTELGYAAIRTSNPTRALALLAAHPCDLLFTDLMMPGGTDGIQLAQQALARQPRLRVLYTSGYAGDMTTSPRPLLHKPYNRDELALAVRQLLDAPPSHPPLEPLP